jgi:hypothetical protein
MRKSKIGSDFFRFTAARPHFMLLSNIHVKANNGVNVKRIVSRALLAKLSHLLANQPVRTLSPASVNSAESENSHLP